MKYRNLSEAMLKLASYVIPHPPALALVPQTSARNLRRLERKHTRR